MQNAIVTRTQLMTAVSWTLFLYLGVQAQGETKLPRVRNEQGPPAEATVAVKDVCAWPNLTVLPDGSIAATIFNQPSHGSLPGDVECWATEDNGTTWHLRGPVTAHEPNTNRMNHAAGLAVSGDLIVVCSGWSNRYADSRSGAAFRAEVLDSWICRSKDGGRTWAVDKTAFPKQAPDGGYAQIPFGDIVAGKDGALHMTTYSMRNSDAGRLDRVWVFRSPDDGTTWGDPVAIHQEGSHNETALLHDGRGGWLAATRTHSRAEDGRRYHLDLFSSENDARSWTFRCHLTQTSQHPGHLLRLDDRKILLSYGNRTKDRGVDSRFSDDEGATWSEPIRVADFQGDGGYPSSVQLRDGRILTAYYASRTAEYAGYQMGVVVWDPAETLKSADP